jgi:hypothetical protein
MKHNIFALSLLSIAAASSATTLYALRLPIMGLRATGAPASNPTTGIINNGGRNWNTDVKVWGATTMMTAHTAMTTVTVRPTTH